MSELQKLNPEVFKQLRKRARRRKSDKPVAQLTGEEAFQRIQDCRLEFRYREFCDLFKKWWGSLPPDVRRELAFAAEKFRDHADYNRQWVLRGIGGVWFGRPPRFEDAFRSFDESLPRISRSDYEEIVSAIRSGEQVRQRGKKRPKARLLVQDHLDRYNSAVREAFGLTQGRTKAAENRFLAISGWQYSGLTYEQAVERWKEQHPDEKRLDPETVGRETRRFRKERENLAWGLRAMIFQRGFPRLESLLCPNCNGEGEVRNPKWVKWYEWWPRCCAAMSNPKAPDPGPEPKTTGSGSVSCSACGGTGFRKFSSL